MGAGVLLGEVARLALLGRFGSCGQYRLSDCLQVTPLALNTSLSSEGAHGAQGDRPRYIMNQMDQGSAEWTLLPSKR